MLWKTLWEMWKTHAESHFFPDKKRKNVKKVVYLRKRIL